MDLIRGFVPGWVALVFSIPLWSCQNEFQELGIDLKIQKRTYSNGLQLITVEDPTVPVVAYQTWVRVGSVDEVPGKTGMAHLFEHLMFKGTESYGPKEFFNRLEARGAEVNAFTTRDYTVFYENFSPDLLPEVIDLEAKRLRGLKLTEEVMNTEKQVVLEERRLRTDDSPGGKIQEALWQLSYVLHPYQWPVIGYMQDVVSVTLKDLKEFYDRYYVPANTTIVVVGAIQAPIVEQLVQNAYGKLRDLYASVLETCRENLNKMKSAG